MPARSRGAAVKRASGRPLSGPRRLVRKSFTLDPRHAEWLRSGALARGVSASRLLDETLAEARRHGAGRGARRGRVRITIPERALAEFCARRRIRRLALFGSVLTPRFGPRSDIDVLVDFEPGAVPSFFELAAMEEECSVLLGGRRVDLRSRGDLGRFVRGPILRDAEVIYGA